MRKDITVVAEPRSSRGKNEARRLRVSGQAPAVLYGAGGEILNIPAEGGFPQTTFTSVAKGWAVGGGLEVRYKQHWVIQLIEFDYERTYFEDFSKTVLSPTERNRRLSAAIVYRWGKAK